jgi:hypothetical protein
LGKPCCRFTTMASEIAATPFDFAARIYQKRFEGQILQ